MRITEPQKCHECRTPLTITYDKGEQIPTCPQCVGLINEGERMLMAFDRANRKGIAN